MTYRQWEKAFRKRLSRLPKEERERALGYYAELYGDKLDAGVSESEIVREFGDPKAAADKIIAEPAENHLAIAQICIDHCSATPRAILLYQMKR